MNDVQIALLAARTLIADPKDWTQGYYARTRRGERVSDANPGAVCFCASGAIWFGSYARGHSYDDLVDKAHSALRLALGEGGDVTGFNDTHTHAEVLDAFDRAIELAGRA